MSSPRQFFVSPCAFGLLTAMGCGLLPLGVFADNPASPHPASTRKPESGIASWHDPDAHTGGSRTASQRPWVGTDLVAAHKTLPLGTRVRVFNLSNGRQVVVVITDRGPYRHGRIIDVSRSAAKELGLMQAGTAHVRLEAIKPDGS